MSEKLKKEYEQAEEKLEELKKAVLYILNKQVSNESIKIHSLTTRIKDFKSIQEKVKRKKSKGEELENPLVQITDLVGVRIVLLLRSDLEKVASIIRQHFHVISEDNKIDNQETNSFGYMSNHFVVNIKHSYIGPHYDGIKQMACEIQVRTIAMDAWAAISHYLDYKNEHNLPLKLKRIFTL